MDEQRKYAILFAATILAARKLNDPDIKAWPRAAASTDAIQKAEQILEEIDPAMADKAHRNRVMMAMLSSRGSLSAVQSYRFFQMTEPESTIASDRLPARSTGQWVQGKNYYLRRYLDIMTRGVAKKWDAKLAYIDLFAGPGRSIIRGTREEVEGSPILSLNYQFSKYVFVDKSEVLEVLKKRLIGHPKFPEIAFVVGDCNDVISDVRSTWPPDHLALAFIDPTGLQIRFRTIERLVQNRKVDLLMTLQFGMGIKRNLQQYIGAEKATLTGFMGNAAWREDAMAGGSASQVVRRITSRYMRQLRDLGYRTYRDREIEIRNDQNVFLYFMAFVSRHALGGKFWREAIKIEWTGQRQIDYQSVE